MSLMPELQNLAIRIATEFKAVRTLITGSATGDLAGLQTVDKSSVIAAINEAASAGGAASMSELTDVTITSPVTGHIIRWAGAEFVNVLGTDFFQAADPDLAAIADLATTPYGRGLLTLADQAALAGALPPATEATRGLMEVATQVETDAGLDDARAVTPLKLQTRMSAYVAVQLADLVGSAPETLDTLEEIAAAIAANQDGATAMTTALGLRVRVDASQAFDAAQQAQGRANIGAQSAADIGDTSVDLVALFNSSLA